ncbi:MAG: hypothetical protein ACLPKZ_09470, partial [Acidimicrobiales bacterium]
MDDGVLTGGNEDTFSIHYPEVQHVVRELKDSAQKLLCSNAPLAAPTSDRLLCRCHYSFSRNRGARHGNLIVSNDYLG